MKKVVALVAFAGLATAATMSYAGMGARTGVNGSFHDMNNYAPSHGGQKEKYERVCVYCHTPHNAVVQEPGSQNNFLPRWNHSIDSVQFAAYNWATPDNTPFTISDPLMGPSRLCMSCHDGNFAVDQHGPAMPNAGVVTLAGNRAIGHGNDLSTTHPIGFSYVDARNGRNDANAAINGAQEIVPETERFASGITINPDPNSTTYNTVERLGSRTIKSTLYNGSFMTCATCHEVHNKENAAQAPATDGSARPNYFIYAPEQYSLICLSCHVK
jgi:cytochrome c5